MTGIPTRRRALAIARGLGLEVQNVRRTGEVRVTDPATGEHVTHDNRRKDASRALVAFVAFRAPQPRKDNNPE